jgi:hypothetical protein
MMVERFLEKPKRFDIFFLLNYIKPFSNERFFNCVKCAKCEAKTKHLFLMKTVFFRELLSHNTKIVQIQK